MKLNHQQLINLPVYTQKEDFLGRVSGFELSTQTHTVIKYFVSQSSLVKNLLGAGGHNLEIASAQVISISEEKMIVEDNIVQESVAVKKNVKQSAVVPAVLSRLSE